MDKVVFLIGQLPSFASMICFFLSPCNRKLYCKWTGLSIIQEHTEWTILTYNVCFSLRQEDFHLLCSFGQFKCGAKTIESLCCVSEREYSTKDEAVVTV